MVANSGKAKTKHERVYNERGCGESEAGCGIKDVMSRKSGIGDLK